MSVLSEMVGRKVVDVKGLQVGSDCVVVVFEDAFLLMYHHQDCCESVSINQVDGDASDLIGAELVMAEESTSNDSPPPDSDEYASGSLTWTFYRFATVKGYVNIRWFGESNGYYSESVTCAVKTDGQWRFSEDYDWMTEVSKYHVPDWAYELIGGSDED